MVKRGILILVLSILALGLVARWDGAVVDATPTSNHYAVVASDAPVEWKNSADWLCDGTDDQVEIQAANDACVGSLIMVQLSPGNFNVQDDLIIDGCTLSGQGPGGPVSTYATRLNLSDGKTITIRRYLAGAGRMRELLIYCPSGFTGDALEIAAGVGDVKGLLENVRLYCHSYDDTGTPTGRGLWLHAEATTNNRYVANNSCFGVSVEGFEYGVVLTAEDSATNDGWVNANIFFDLNITHCKNSLVLDDAGTNPGAVEGNYFLPVTIESYDGAVNGVHLATTVNRNEIKLSEWSPPAWYSGSLILCDVGTAYNVIDGHFDVTGVTDNASYNIIEKSPKRGSGTRVYNSAPIPIPNATTTTLTFDSERYDTADIHSTTSDTGRLTCRAAGQYIINATVDFASNANGRRQVGIYLNGNTLIALQGWNTNQMAGTYMVVSTIYYLGIGDYVEVRVYQSSGGTLNIELLGQASLEFMMQRLAN